MAVRVLGDHVAERGMKLRLAHLRRLRWESVCGMEGAMTAFGPEATPSLRRVRSAVGCMVRGCELLRLLRLTRP
jgi:hypothetical protein